MFVTSFGLQYNQHMYQRLTKVQTNLNFVPTLYKRLDDKVFKQLCFPTQPSSNMFLTYLINNTINIWFSLKEQ